MNAAIENKNGAVNTRAHSKYVQQMHIMSECSVCRIHAQTSINQTLVTCHAIWVQQILFQQLRLSVDC